MGRLRLYRRLYACAKVLALIAAGALGIVYLNRPEMIRLHASVTPSICSRSQAAMLHALGAGLRYVRENRAIRRASTGTATVSPANPGRRRR